MVSPLSERLRRGEQVPGNEPAIAEQRSFGDVTSALVEASALRPETQALLTAYWKRTLSVEVELRDFEARSKAQTFQNEAQTKAGISQSKARVQALAAEALTSAVFQEQKTKVYEENGKRLVLRASMRADIAQARCREAAAKRRLAELEPRGVERRCTEGQGINETHHLELPLNGPARFSMRR